MGDPNPGIDWQAIISALDHGHDNNHSASANEHALALAQTQSQGPQHAVSNAPPNAGSHRQHNRSSSSGQHSDGGQQEDDVATVKHRRGSESGGGRGRRRRRSSTRHTSTPATASTASSSPGVDTHRYHPAHAQAAAVAQAQAQAVVAEALARNHPIPDDLFAHFARANGFMGADGAAAVAAAAAGATAVTTTPESLPWSVAPSPDMKTRISMAPQPFGYVSPQQTTMSPPPLNSLPVLGPGPPPPVRQSSTPIAPVDAGLGFNSAFVSTAPSLASAQTPSVNGDDTEDKRVRNTLASARFRAKKKLYIETVERNIRELETQHRELEVEVNDLRKENGLLREMVQLKYGIRQ